ncbi:hypothetical protein GCM10022243_54110 [Saccharothrix violaceirubra]|uniref:YbaB/EbfC DNA-binding family protein n=1 Tax=Saccharothrix violaceirubra TaxID=413306 RepID=A0A7W7T5H8_9PSEU|nr:YbaB/EbfC family nucleoid-associated protein [Saccharothrix violaceirubra]MBB4966921.1 hypothetical protein [Saccharothrix violaceirubra]
MTDPLANVQRLVDEWERDAEEKSARYESVRHEVERICITASAAGGAVSVTVGPNGIPSAVTMTDGVSRVRPAQIAAAVMEAMAKARAGYPAPHSGDERLCCAVGARVDAGPVAAARPVVCVPPEQARRGPATTGTEEVVMRWYCGDGYGWGMLPVIGLSVLLVIVIAVVAVVLVRSQRGGSAARIVDERLARGEIDTEEHARLRSALRSR